MKTFVSIPTLPDGYGRVMSNALYESQFNELCHLNRNVSPQEAFFYLYRKFGAGSDFFDEYKTMACYLLQPKRCKDIIFEVLIMGSCVYVFAYISPRYQEQHEKEEVQAAQKYVEEVAQYAIENHRRDAFCLGWHRLNFMTYMKEVGKDQEIECIHPAYRKRITRKYYAYLVAQGKQEDEWENFVEWVNKDFEDSEERLHGFRRAYRFQHSLYYKTTPQERQAERERVLAYYPQEAVLRKIVQAFSDLETFFRKDYASVRDVSFNFFGERK